MNPTVLQYFRHLSRFRPLEFYSCSQSWLPIDFYFDSKIDSPYLWYFGRNSDPDTMMLARWPSPGNSDSRQDFSTGPIQSAHEQAESTLLGLDFDLCSQLPDSSRSPRFQAPILDKNQLVNLDRKDHFEDSSHSSVSSHASRSLDSLKTPEVLPSWFQGYIWQLLSQLARTAPSLSATPIPSTIVLVSSSVSTYFAISTWPSVFETQFHLEFF